MLYVFPMTLDLIALFFFFAPDKYYIRVEVFNK